MKSGLLILPFIALLVGAVSTLIASAFPVITWMTALGWALAAGIVALWILLDLENFRAFFLRKGTKYGASSGLVVLMVLAVIIGAALLTVRPRFNKSYDATHIGINTLSDQSLKIVEKIKSQKAEIRILAFFQSDQTQESFRDLIRLYEAKGANFLVEYIDPQRERTKAIAEKITSGNTVIFRFSERESRLTTFNEEKVTNALVNIFKESSKKIYFTKGHGEGEIKGQEALSYGIAVEALQQNKYSVAEIKLLETPKVPDDADLVIVAGPQYDLKEQELASLESYLKRGGSVLVMVDATKPVKQINTLLEKFGLKYENDFLVLRPDDPHVQLRLVGQDQAIVDTFDEFNPVTRDFAKQAGVALLMGYSRSLSEVSNNPNSMKVTLAAKSSASVIQVKDVKSEQDLKNLGPGRFSVNQVPVIAVAVGQSKTGLDEPSKEDPEKTGKATDKKNTDKKGHFKEIRLIATGSSQFARNSGVQASENLDMFLNMASYLLQDEDFISIRPKDPEKTTLQLTSGWSQLSMLLLSFVYPFAFLGTGVIYWLRRRKD